MTIPSDPSSASKPQSTPQTPADSSQTAPPASESLSAVDPTGQWTKFLSSGGGQATAKDVRLFLDGLLKGFNVLIQQNQRAAKRAADAMKKAIEGQ